MCIRDSTNITGIAKTTQVLYTNITGIAKTTLLAIEIAAPVGGVLLLTICIMCCMIMTLCVRQARAKHTRDSYNFQRLSIAAQNYDDAEDEEEDEGNK